MAQSARFTATDRAQKGGFEEPGYRAISRWSPHKILGLTDALGNLVSFRLMPGQVHDLRETAEIIEGISCKMSLADRAFDANWLRETLGCFREYPGCIPPKSRRKFPPEFDNHSYKMAASD